MAKALAEWMFKVLVLAIAAVAVSIYWQKRNDGRYLYQHQQSTAEAAEDVSVFDTRTGTLYSWSVTADKTGNQSVVFLEIHPQTRTVIGRKGNVTK